MHSGAVVCCHHKKIRASVCQIRNRRHGRVSDINLLIVISTGRPVKQAVSSYIGLMILIPLQRNCPGCFSLRRQTEEKNDSGNQGDCRCYAVYMEIPFDSGIYSNERAFMAEKRRDSSPAARSRTACKHQDRTWPDRIEGSLKGQPSLESKAKLPRSESAKKFADESAALPIAPLLILFLVGVRLRHSR